ncbi:holin family protein [Clostridioides difficile DA00165]|nr:holin family protein [Clostridioides difficile DA00165]
MGGGTSYSVNTYVDYIFGIIKGFVLLSSNVGFKGIAKKVEYW